MKKYIWVAFIAFILGLVAAGYFFVARPEKSAPPQEPVQSVAASPLNTQLLAAAPEVKQALDFVAITEKVGPAVVKVVAERREKVSAFGLDEGWPFGDFWDRFFNTPQPREQEQVQTAQGTGFFISPDGYILTNNHIVENSQKVQVMNAQGDEFDADVKGRDPRTDLALLKINIKNAPFAELGDSSQIKVGEWVVAIGNPFGYENTVTAGIVSAKGRQVIGDSSTYEDFIQTDAAINRGNSGGPLINMRGEVVGITSVILAPAGGNIGIGFAIPSNMAAKVVAQLKEKGRVSRGRLGVQVQNITEGMAKQWKLASRKGALVSSVDPDSPADKAGLKQYDVIVAIEGQPVENMSVLRFKVADFQPGKKIALKVIRDGKEMTLHAVLEELDPEVEKGEVAGKDKDIGLSLTPLTPGLARRYGLRTTEGLLITEVRQGSEAYRSGLRAGMIIIEVNRRKVTSVREFESLLGRTEPGDELILLVRSETERGFQDAIIPVKVR